MYFLVFCLHIAFGTFAFSFIVFVIICFTETINDTYVDRTYIYKLRLHRVRFCASKTGLSSQIVFVLLPFPRIPLLRLSDVRATVVSYITFHLSLLSLCLLLYVPRESCTLRLVFSVL